VLEIPGNSAFAIKQADAVYRGMGIRMMNCKHSKTPCVIARFDGWANYIDINSHFAVRCVSRQFS